MNILERYIAKTVLLSIALVSVMLFGLQIFILFVSELRSIGQGDYTVWQAFIYVLMQAPYQVYLFFPTASLLGCLLGLGLLAGNSELIVMGAAGFSVRQIALAVLKAAILVIILVSLLGETFVPKWVYAAEDRKLSLLSGGKSVRVADGLWLRDAKSFIYVIRVASPEKLLGIMQYEFNAQQELKIIRQAQSASYQQGHWTMYGVQESHLNPQGINIQRYEEQPWATEMSPRLLSVATIEADELNIKQLRDFIAEQKKHHLEVNAYELTFWKRLFQPLTVCVMMLLAIPFIFGPLRTATMGLRFLAGTVVGFSFYLLNQLFSPLSIVYQLPPLVGALAPTVFFAILAMVMLSRVRS